MNATIVKHVLVSAVRDKIILSLLLILGFVISISIFLGSSAIVESEQFAIVYSSALMRVTGVLGLILFITFSVRRLFDSREIDFILACPVKRPSFVFSVIGAYVVVGILLAVAVAVVLFLLFGKVLVFEGLAFWTFGLMMEYILLAAATLFFALFINSAASCALVTLCFYTLSRFVGQFLNIADNVSGKTQLKNVVMGELSTIFDGISLLVPRLDLMVQSSWLIYGTADAVVGYAYVFCHGLSFSLILAVAAIIDLLRKQF